MNYDIAHKVTPVYNTFLLISAAFFAYFIVVEENQCYAKNQEAWAVEYDDTVDVTKQFYLLANCGLILLLVSVLMYYLQGKEDMFELMRPYVIITNLVTLAWFVALQYYRFKDTGKACSGDLLIEKPENFADVYLSDEGTFMQYYIFAHYGVYVIQKIVCICITNKHETEYEKRKAIMQNRV